MIRNYLKIALRQLRQQKMYAAIKIGGFALSIAACILITLYINNELSYDRDNPDGERVYRVVGNLRQDGNINRGPSMPAPFAKAVKNDFPEVEKAGRLMSNIWFNGAGSNQIRAVDQKENSYQEGFCFADQEAIDILHIPVVQGNPATVLAEPFSILISARKAKQFFPGQNPVGKTMIFNDQENRPLKIGGVMADPAENSHLQYDYYISLAGNSFWNGEQEEWLASNYDIYLQLKPGTDAKAFEKKLTKGILGDYMIPRMKAANVHFANDLEKNAWLELQPLRSIHLDARNMHDSISHGDIRFVWLFGAVALFILLLACVNFINLSTAKSANRAREVGLRKVIGSLRSSLIGQFLTESVLMSVFSFVVAILLAWLFLPFFNQVAEKNLEMPWTSAWFLPVLLIAALLVGLLAGIYPSLYLSSFKPVQVLKGDISRGARSSLLRNVLVVFQFTCSIALIIATVVVYTQTKYMLNRNVGFDKDQVLVIQGTNTLNEKVRPFRDELLKQSAIQSASIGDYLPVNNTKRNGNAFWLASKRQTDAAINGQFWVIDPAYLQTIGIKLVQGRNFDPKMATDSQSVIINQAMANKLGLKAAPGQQITNGNVYTIIGVVQDFNYESMQQEIKPLVLALGESNSMISVKTRGGDAKTAIAQIEKVWHSFMPNQQIRYNFLDNSFAQMYKDVQRMQQIFSSFAVLAILIACLGLFALSAFMVEQRNKEMSIRKVLGASALQINHLLSKDFLLLVLIAFAIAAPLAWYGMRLWLQDYVYRIGISWWMFALAALLVTVIAMLTISLQSVKASRSNPVDGLRN